MKHWLLSVALACLIAPAFQAYSATLLPVYIEDNHAGTFYFLSDELDRTRTYHLILFDRHNDATAIPGSDYIRQKIIETSVSDRTGIFNEWNTQGVIQCFNWLEPLIPSPISKVTWIPSEAITDKEYASKSLEIKGQINAYTDVIERKNRDLSAQYLIMGFSQLRKLVLSDMPVVVSIDLDYFADMNERDAEREFSRIMDYTLGIRSLSALTIAISRPYLKSDSQAEHLLSMAMKNVLGIINARVNFEPFLAHGIDRSRLAYSHYSKKVNPAYFKLDAITDSMKSFLLTNNGRILVRHDSDRWKKYIKKWDQEIAIKPEITIHDSQGNTITSNPCYILSNEQFSLSIGNPLSDNDKLSWMVQEPGENCFNVLGDYGFAEGKKNLVIFKETIARELDGIEKPGTAELAKLYNKGNGCGTLRICAQISRNGKIYRSPYRTIIRYKSDNYIGKLTEICNLPYIFGSSSLRFENAFVTDARFGADCSNFIIYGWRRMGFSIPYLNPLQLKQYLVPIGKAVTFSSSIAMGSGKEIKINQEQIDRGLIIHFGKHVAAIYEDRPPYNVLSSNDLVIHQLEGYPEIIELGKLKYSKKPFDIMILNTSHYSSRDNLLSSP